MVLIVSGWWLRWIGTLGCCCGFGFGCGLLARFGLNSVVVWVIDVVYTVVIGVIICVVCCWVLVCYVVCCLGCAVWLCTLWLVGVVWLL